MKDLTIDSLKANLIPEVNNVLTTEQITTLITYFTEEFGEDYEDLSELLVGKTYLEAVLLIDDDNEFYFENLQHVVNALHSDIYTPIYF
jgi:hypothetical protein